MCRRGQLTGSLRHDVSRTLMKDQLPSSVAMDPDRAPQRFNVVGRRLTPPRCAKRCEHDILRKRKQMKVGKLPSIRGFPLQRINHLHFGICDAIRCELGELIGKQGVKGRWRPPYLRRQQLFLEIPNLLYQQSRRVHGESQRTR